MILPLMQWWRYVDTSSCRVKISCSCSIFVARVFSLVASDIGQIYVTDAQEALPTFCTVYTHMVKAGGSSIKQQLLIASHKSGGRKPCEGPPRDFTSSFSCCPGLSFEAPCRYASQILVAERLHFALLPSTSFCSSILVLPNVRTDLRTKQVFLSHRVCGRCCSLCSPRQVLCNQGGSTDEACLEAASNATVITGGNVEKLR